MSKFGVYGVYLSQRVAEKTVDQLKIEGLNDSDVSLVYSSAASDDEAAAESTKSDAPPVVSEALRWLVGSGNLSVPGLGPLFAAGPIMATLGSTGIGAAIGGFSAALVSMGVPEYEAKRYEGRLKHGGILISVHADNDKESEKARKILERTGAEDISKRNAVLGKRPGSK